MPDTEAVNIINVNMDSIEAASIQKENCNTNRSDAKKNKTPSRKLMRQRRAVQTLMRI